MGWHCGTRPAQLLGSLPSPSKDCGCALARPRSDHQAGLETRGSDVKGRDVILHTDGAKTYRMKLRGVLRDNVALTKKSDGVKGKPVWVKPHFAKMCQHKLPHGKRVTVKLPPAHLPETQGRVHCACPVNFEFCSAHTGIEPKAFGSLLARCFRICTPN